jgi:IS5 family transposase
VPRAVSFVLHAKALPGNPYDGHALRDVIDQTQKAHRARAAYADKGDRGDDTENPRCARWP